MIFSFEQIYHFLSFFFFPFCRVSTLMMTLPFFNEISIPKRVRIVLAFFITLSLLDIFKDPVVTDLMSFEAILVCFKEILMALLMAFIFQIVMQTFIFASQFISTQIGLSFASLVNPAYGSVPFLGQFYSLLVILLFLSLNGHLLLIELIANSFEIMPVSLYVFSAKPFAFVLELFTWSLQAALIFCLPIIITLLLVNMVLGFLTRAAPQINIFSISFSVTLLIGFFVIYLTLMNIQMRFESVFDMGFMAVRHLGEMTHVG